MKHPNKSRFLRSSTPFGGVLQYCLCNRGCIPRYSILWRGQKMSAHSQARECAVAAPRVRTLGLESAHSQTLLFIAGNLWLKTC